MLCSFKKLFRDSCLFDFARVTNRNCKELEQGQLTRHLSKYKIKKGCKPVIVRTISQQPPSPTDILIASVFA